jgi:hypothetical protein
MCVVCVRKLEKGTKTVAAFKKRQSYRVLGMLLAGQNACAPKPREKPQSREVRGVRSLTSECVGGSPEEALRERAEINFSYPCEKVK